MQCLRNTRISITINSETQKRFLRSMIENGNAIIRFQLAIFALYLTLNLQLNQQNAGVADNTIYMH